MKRVVVKVTNNSQLEAVKDSILGQYSYLTFVDKFRSFGILTVDVPEENEDDALGDIRGVEGVKSAFWDKENIVCDPVEIASTAVEYDEGAEHQAVGDASSGTRNLTSSGFSTIYVKVQNISGQNLYVFSNTQAGTYSVVPNYTGFLQGGTFTFDQSDSSNAGHPFRFSVTANGTFGGGSEYNTGVTTNGTPGQAGAYTRLATTSATPAILFYYCTAHSGMGRYAVSPDRYGTINLHDFWHLDRISKIDRSYMNAQYSYTQDGDGVDLYVIDSGVRGSSRPTGNNAALHPELYNPDFVTDLNGLSEQQQYRVFQMSHYSGAYGTNNEDDNGHGTYCAILAAGRTAGVSNKSRIYSLKAFNSSLSASYSGIVTAYQAVIDHNDSTDANYKGNTRAAVINASFGPTTPNGGYPFIELNESGTDAGVELEVLDEIEKTVAQNNIIIVRSAGNGFKDSSDNFAGPLQGRFVAGNRTAGYLDSVFNAVDSDTDKISVGATEYNDTWADFSNYGLGVTTVAPGTRVLVPTYDWTANTTYSNTNNYSTIAGTSFSGPIVAGAVLSWVQKNSYDYTTSNLPGLAKTWVRSDISVFSQTGSGNTAYPTDTMIERPLPTNCFAVTNGSSQVEVTYASQDATYFANKVGKKVQLNVPNPTVVGNLDIYAESITSWFGIVSEDAANYKITIALAQSATLTTTGGGGSMGIISDTHEETDGPIYSNTTLFTQTDTQEAYSGVQTYDITVTAPDASRYTLSGTDRLGSVSGDNQPVTISVGDTVNFNLSNVAASHPFRIRVSSGGADVSTPAATGQGSTGNNTVSWTPNTAGSFVYQCQSHGGMLGAITVNTVSTSTSIGTGRPVQSGVDYDPNGVGTTTRGLVYPYVDQVVTWVNNSGALSASPFANSAVVSGIDLGLSAYTTWANEPISEGNYSIASSPALTGSGLTFTTTTGILGGTVTSSFNDTTYNLTVTHLNSGQTRNFSFVTTGTGVQVTITQQPSNASVEAAAGTNATFTVAGTASDASTVTFQWEYSTDGGNTFSTISSLAGHSGETTSTLTVDDDYNYNSYQYRCVLDSATAVATTTSNVATLTVYRVVTIGTQPLDQTPVAPASATFTSAASTLDGATITYQWERSDDGVTYSNINGATSAAYTLATTSYDSDYGRYFRVVCDAAGSQSAVTSNAARLFLTRTINITGQPVDITGAVGGTSQFTVTADTSDNDAADITYQWQFSIDSGANWSNVVGGSGATAATYTTPTLDSTYDEHRYRCILNAPQATQVISGSATLQVETVTPIVTTQPTDATADENTTASFTCVGDVTMGQIGANAASSSFDSESFTTPAGGGGGSVQLQSQHEPAVTYQWQRSDDGGNSWSGVSGATSSVYTTPSLVYANDNNDQYRCEVNAPGASAPVYSNTVTLTVQRTFTITSQPANTTGNEGSTASLSIAVNASSGTPTYQWERSDDGGANYSPVSGATSSTYITPTLVYADDNDDRYRCVVSLTGSAASSTSTFAVLTVLRVITITQQPADLGVIEGAQGTFTIAASITSDVVSYQWNLSIDDGNNFSPINGANSPSYTTPATVYPTTPSHKFRCTLTNVAATTVSSNIVTLTVNESEFVSAPTTVTVNLDPDTNKTLDRVPTITSSAFVSQYTGSTHFSTFWRIRRVSDNVTVYDTTNTFTNGDTGNLTSFTVPAGTLAFNTAYNVQVKYRDNNGLESAYTANTTFTTPFVDQPDIQTIVAAFNPTITVNASEFLAGYQHTSSDWQFSGDSLFTNIVHQSLGNTANLTSYVLPQDVTLDPNTTYYVRIRFNVNPL